MNFLIAQITIKLKWIQFPPNRTLTIGNPNTVQERSTKYNISSNLNKNATAKPLSATISPMPVVQNPKKVTNSMLKKLLSSETKKGYLLFKNLLYRKICTIKWITHDNYFINITIDYLNHFHLKANRLIYFFLNAQKKKNVKYTKILMHLNIFV